MNSVETDRGAAPGILAFSRRRRWLTWLWFVLTVGLLSGILVFANLLAARHPLQWDFTLERVYSINDNTRVLLSRIDRDLTIYVTHLKANPYVEDNALPQAWVQLRNLLEEFQRANPARIRVKSVDREGDAVITEIQALFEKESNANMVYVVALRGDGQPPAKRTVPISELYEGDRVTGTLKSFTGEARIGAAILQATSDVKRVIYFTTGHKELVPSPADDGFSTVQRNLESLHNATVKELDLPRTAAIPPDCDVLLMAGPSVDFDPRELDVIQGYLEGGGRLFAAPDHGSCKELGRLLEKWGIRPNLDIVLDPTNPADGQMVRIRQFSEHEINAGMRNTGFMMPLTRSVTPAEARDPNHSATGLMYAAKDAWAQPVTREKGIPEPDDPRSPCVAACASVKVDKPRNPRRPAAKIVVWGSPMAISNYNLKTGIGTREDYVNYILNNFRWLMDEEGMISAMPLRLERKPLEMTEGQKDILFWITVVAMPFTGVLLGMVAWFFRRS